MIHESGQETNWRIFPEGFPTERLCITRFWRIMSAAAPFINRHFLFSSHILWLLSHPRTLAALERSRLGPLLPINSSLIFSTHLHCHYPATHLHSYICVSCVHIKGFGFLRNFTFLSAFPLHHHLTMICLHQISPFLYSPLHNEEGRRVFFPHLESKTSWVLVRHCISQVPKFTWMFNRIFWGIIY